MQTNTSEDYRNNVIRLTRSRFNDEPNPIQLVQVFPENSKTNEDFKFKWFGGTSGLGGAPMPTTLNLSFKQAARDLLEEGLIVPTSEPIAWYGSKRAKLCEYFDDVRWGLTNKNEIVILKLSKQESQDEIIPLDEYHEKALERLENKRHTNQTEHGTLLIVRDQEITPILTNPDEILIRRRELSL